MNPGRSDFQVSALAILLAAAGIVAAQSYPSKPIRYIIAFPPGGHHGSRRGGWCWGGDGMVPPGWRHGILLTIVLALFPMTLFGATTVHAQSYPTKPIRYIVAFPPGGGQDLVARALAPKLAEAFGQQVVVENRPGAGTIIGAEAAARSAPDGYTIFMGSNTTNAINPNIYKKLPYDPIKDFAAVTQVASVPNILVVHPSLPARTLKELVALAKAHRGELNFASSGNGTPAQLAGVMFNAAAGINIIHIPYRGSGAALTAVIGGESHLMFGTLTSTLSYAKSGRLRALAITGAKRSPAVPQMPTIAESGYPGYEAVTWYGVLAPAKTPSQIVARLNAEFVKILKDPATKEWLLNQGAEAVGNSPEEFAAYMASELVKYATVVKDAGMHPD